MTAIAWSERTAAQHERRSRGVPDRTRPRGVTLQRCYAQDIWHIAELNETLGAAGLEQIDFWS
jgi:hypothetical protein